MGCNKNLPAEGLPGRITIGLRGAFRSNGSRRLNQSDWVLNALAMGTQSSIALSPERNYQEMLRDTQDRNDFDRWC